MMKIIILILTIFTVFFGCSEKMSSYRTKKHKSSSSLGSQNTLYSVPNGHGRVLLKNPIILTDNTHLPADVNLDTLLPKIPQFITNEQYLRNSCGPPGGKYVKEKCFEVLEDSQSTSLPAEHNRWAFPANGMNFLQVHTYYHVNRSIKRFQDNIYYAYTKANPLGATGGGSYLTGIPQAFYEKGVYWSDRTLLAYSNCDINPLQYSYFDPGGYFLCLAKDNIYLGVYFAQDPSVIYHEMGHVYTYLLMNNRGKVDGLSVRTDLGDLSYDEGSSINEGLSDFYSFMMTQRTHLGEWALGRFRQASRPMTETDPLEIPAINLDVDSRLSYPKYVDYNPNDPTVPAQDPHYTGQTAVFFLVALTEKIKEQCKLTLEDTTKVIEYLLFETYSELGDLTTIGSNNQPEGKLYNRVNLVKKYNKYGSLVSKLWGEVVNPPTYRRFFQVFSNYFLKVFTGSSPVVACPGGKITQDDLEKLLDMYGLLLFRTYNDNGNGYQTGHTGDLTSINLDNRERTELIDKDLLILDPDQKTADAYVIDKGKSISDMLASLKAAGKVTNTSTMIPSSLPYNNDNAALSPGEVVGVALNLYNNSNSIMGGIQVIGNDWDHGKLVDWNPSDATSGELKPCNTFADHFPLDSEGAAPKRTTASPQIGDCEYITRFNGIHDGSADDEVDLSTNQKEILMPICLVQYRDAHETLWVSQKRFYESINLSPQNCLMGSSSPYDCLVRVIPGAEVAYYSKMDPKSTWSKTLTSGNKVPSFSSYNLILMELNPWIPPGTTFLCRFRAHFTNCENCWRDTSRSDGDDYLDYEFSGGDPFKIIHFQFTVID